MVIEGQVLLSIGMHRMLNTCRMVYLLLVAFCFLPETEAATFSRQDLLEVQDGANNFDLNRTVKYIEDKTGKLSLNDLLKANLYQYAIPGNKTGPINLGYSSSAFWIIQPIKYRGKSANKIFWLQLDLPLLENSELYMVSKEGKVLLHKSMGYETELKDRDINHVNQVYEISLPKNEEVAMYLRIENNFSIHLSLNMMTPEGFLERAKLEKMFYGAFIGACLIMFAYNLFVFISVRENSFLYYILYILTYLVFIITERVHGLEIFGTIPAMFNKQYLAMYIWISWLFALLMARSFLETKAREPDLDQVIKVFIRITAINLVITHYTDLTSGIRWAVLGTILYAIVMVWMAYVVMKRGNPAAKFYFIAWLLNFSGAAVYALTITGFVPFNFVTSNSPHLGILCQIVLISFALADRLKVAQRLTLAANTRALLTLKRYRSLFNNAVEGIFQVGLNRRFMDLNPSMATMLGYRAPKDALRIRKDAFLLCFSELSDRDYVVSLLESGEEVIDYEAPYQSNGNGQRWSQITMRIIYDDEGNPSHIEGTFIDITERKEKERIEKEREQERLAKELANASAAAKTQFLANMSHEIRTPLTAIIGYGESLLDDSLSASEKRDSAEVVVRSGRHLLSLINDILDHSKIDANKLDTEVIQVNLLELLEDVKTYFHSRAREKGIEFRVQHVFPLPKTIQSDPTRLKQILINLCGNALKFTERGSITVNVRCDREQERLVFKVMDTGIGLKPDQMHMLFDPFAQASPTIARQYGGTGLGLSISKRLVEMLGGEISAHSTFGEGTEFEFSVATGLLQSVAFVRDSSELASQRPVLRNAAVPRLKGRVLYAEDNEINRRLVAQLVGKTGASLSLVTNGAEALEIATREQFDLILMDIQMPVMDGRDATSAIRRAGITTPIIALTANVMADDIAEYAEAGCNETHAKPVEKRSFYSMLSRYLEEDTQVNTDLAKATTEASATEVPLLSGTILLADDNADNRMLMKRYLTRAGLKMIEAENGKQAVQLALSNSVQLVIVDQHMPEMNGPDAAKMLRQTGFVRPILAFTASDDEVELKSMMDAGCNDAIHKPVKTDQLYAMLGKYLQERKPEGGPEKPEAAEKEVTRESLEGHPADALWDDQELRPIVEQFVKSLNDRALKMGEALDRGDWQELKNLSHQIKGTAGSLGFPLLTETAKVLESALKANEIDGVVDLFKNVDAQMKASKRQYDSFAAKSTT